MTYLRRKPLARPSKAAQFAALFNWQVLSEILESGHNNCWLPKFGQLPEDKSLNTGRLNLRQVMNSFCLEGRTLTVRHAELSHRSLGPVAEDFSRNLRGPVDIQLYATPKDGEGFGWHYDLEDVFVIQTLGSKEFYLRKGQDDDPPPHKDLPKEFVLEDYTTGPETVCKLTAGDWLYIPAGYWHKARAVDSESFHVSVGVLNPKL